MVEIWHDRDRDELFNSHAGGFTLEFTLKSLIYASEVYLVNKEVKAWFKCLVLLLL